VTAPIWGGHTITPHTLPDVHQLAAAAFAEAERHAPRTPQRRAASHLAIAASIPPARSIAAVRTAIASFGTERTRASALELLRRLAATAATATEGTSP
jgi:hypothetical protein